MSLYLFQNLGWSLKRRIRSFGVAGVIAVFLGAACGITYTAAIIPLQDRVVALQKEIYALRTIPHTSDAKSIKTPELSEQMAAFYEEFPLKDATPELMTKLYSAAAQQNLSLDQGEYKLIAQHDKKLKRYEIVLPVRGGYPQVRKFIAQALNDTPSLALDSIAFNRQKINDSVVDAQLRFTLYLRAS